MSKPYCIAPWVSLNTTPTGTAPCCSWNDAYNDFDVYRDEYVENVKLKMLNHDFEFLSKSCRRCIEREKIGEVSDRQNFQRYIETGILKNETDIGFMDLRFSNKCNYKCIMCNGWASSSIAKEENLVVPEFYPNSDKFLKLDFNNLRYLKILGGEPTIQSQAFDLLNMLVEKYDASKIIFSYTTNCSTASKKWFDLCNKFKQVYCEMSIEGTGIVNDYIRSGSKWSKVHNNVCKIVEHSKNTDGQFHTQIHTVIGLINLAVIYKWLPWFIDFKNQYNVEAHFYPLDAVFGGSINALQEKYKQEVRDYLYTVDHDYARTIIKMIDVPYSKEEFLTFKNHIQNKDKLRKTSIYDVDPIFEEIMSE